MRWLARAEQDSRQYRKESVAPTGGQGGGPHRKPFNKCSSCPSQQGSSRSRSPRRAPLGAVWGHRAIPGAGVRKLGIDAPTPAHHWLKAAPGSVNSLVICNPVHLGRALGREAGGN